MAIGRVNAVTGEEYDEKIRSHKQDYLVIPEQKWLDGINSGDGLVGQFVAMPLGKGYTVEAQVTDEEIHGGFQVTVFDPKIDRFPDQDPDHVAQRKQNYKQRKNQFSEEHGVVLFSKQRSASVPAGAAPVPGILFSSRRGDISDPFADANPDITNLDLSLKGEESHAAPIAEMGIAKGGSIKQEIAEDTYGADSWDEACRGSIVIHIVNSEVFQRITGLETPPTPITPEQYAKYDIPWFEYYDEAAPTLLPSKKLQYVKSIADIEKIREGATLHTDQHIEISPERLQKIKTPSPEERMSTLFARAQLSMGAKRFEIAAREASYTIDLMRDLASNSEIIKNENEVLIEMALELRSAANLALGRFQDAEGDASECLQINEANLTALSIRAQALIGMNEHGMAILDANSYLHWNATDSVVRLVLAEGYLASGSLDLAMENANIALQSNSKAAAAYRVRGIAYLRKGKYAEAMNEATTALIFGDSDIRALLARAEAFLEIGNPYDARQDLEEVMRMDAGNAEAMELLSKLPKARKKRPV